MFSYDFSRLPFVSMTGKASETTGWSHSGRTMETNLLVIFHSGDCTFEIDGREFSYGAGDIALVPRHTPYRPHTEREAEYTFFHFDGDFVPAELPEAPFHDPADVPFGQPFYGYIDKADTRLYFDYQMHCGSKSQEIELFLNKCLNTQFHAAGGKQLLLSMQFSEMMFHISQAYCEQFQDDQTLPATLRKILLYIQEHYTRSVSLDDISRHTNLSRQYCMRLFKKHMHMTIQEYVCDLRMRYAAYLLRHTYMNVNQTSDYLGFSSVSYFSRVFKRYYGVAPSDYFE